MPSIGSLGAQKVPDIESKMNYPFYAVVDSDFSAVNQRIIDSLSSHVALVAEISNYIDTLLEFVTSIDEEADEMTELVGNLLDMSRIEAGSMPLDPEQCHLADITGDCIKRVSRSRLGGRHEIVVDIPLALPEVFVDYDQVCRVLSNLLSNAIKYSEAGSVISVKSYLVASDSGRIVTEVEDSGVGIPDNEIDKIFDKFYRVTSQRGHAGVLIKARRIHGIAQQHRKLVAIARQSLTGHHEVALYRLQVVHHPA